MSNDLKPITREILKEMMVTDLEIHQEEASNESLAKRGTVESITQFRENSRAHSRNH